MNELKKSNILSDGRFLFCIVSEKPPKSIQVRRMRQTGESGKSKILDNQVVSLAVHVFDPLADIPMEPCHSVILKRPPAVKDGSVLDFNINLKSVCL